MFTDEDLAQWAEWKARTPSSLAQVASADRAFAEMPTPFEIETEIITKPAEQIELVSYANPKGGRVDSKKLRTNQHSSRMIKVKVGDFVAIKRDKPCVQLSSAKAPGWNTPFYIGKVVGFQGVVEAKDHLVC